MSNTLLWAGVAKDCVNCVHRGTMGDGDPGPCPAVRLAQQAIHVLGAYVRNEIGGTHAAPDNRSC